MERFYPSCNFTRQFPQTSERLKKYLSDRFGMYIEGCCRPGRADLEPGDLAVTVCQNCSIIINEYLKGLLGENSPENIREVNVFEILCDDDEFPWPDLHGEKITLQDCFRARDRKNLHEAVRKCLRRMNAEVVELPENREDSMYCGSFLNEGPAPRNLKDAPHYYQDFYPQFYVPMTPEEKKEMLSKHVSRYTTARTVCYCNKCTAGVCQGGGNGIHLMSLMFGIEE